MLFQPHLLKQILPDVIGVITKIVNMSLTTGAFLTVLENSSYSPITQKSGVGLNA